MFTAHRLGSPFGFDVYRPKNTRKSAQTCECQHAACARVVQLLTLCFGHTPYTPAARATGCARCCHRTLLCQCFPLAYHRSSCIFLTLPLRPSRILPCPALPWRGSTSCQGDAKKCFHDLVGMGTSVSKCEEALGS